MLWICRAIILVYGGVLLSTYWFQLTDVETTVRLVGSDVGCSLSAIDCSWTAFRIEKVAGIIIIGIGTGGLFSERAYRNRLLVSAAILAAMHLTTLYLLLNPS